MVMGMPDTGIDKSVNESLKLPSFRFPVTFTSCLTTVRLPWESLASIRRMYAPFGSSVGSN